MTAGRSMRTTLGAVAEFINGGAWSQTEYSSEGVPVIRVTDIKDETVDLSDCKFLPKSALKKYGKHLLREGDLVICTVGSHPTQPGSVVGRPAIIPIRAHGSLLNQNAVCIRTSSPDIDQIWLGYLGRSSEFHDYVKSCARGAANQVRMAIGLFKEMPIDVPPLLVQRRIADILSAYDELIENNQRRIRLLEDMARALYREWFVHFRFPGHESVSRIPSALGDIPQGWEWRKLSDLGFVGRGKSRHRPRNDASLYGGPYPFYQTGDIKDARVFLRSYSQTYSEAGLAQSKLWAPGTLCITIAANIADTAIMAEEGCFPDSVVGFIPDNAKSNAFYVKTYLDSIKERMQNASRGTTQDNLSVEKLLGFLVLTPPLQLMELFGERVSPMLRQLNILLQKEENLRRTRDLLLPRLLSGQVKISENPS